jgi:hypothetical protein
MSGPESRPIDRLLAEPPAPEAVKLVPATVAQEAAMPEWVKAAAANPEAVKEVRKVAAETQWAPTERCQ